jgi:hypothetical protein
MMFWCLSRSKAGASLIGVVTNLELNPTLPTTTAGVAQS